MALTRSKDRKVTNAVSPNGKTAVIANSFGLPAGKAFSCPGATPFCERICYAGKLEKVYKGVRNVLMSNWNQLQNVTFSEMVELLDRMITDFEAECDKRGADKAFRIHWDGDFFSEDYATAWSIVIQRHPDVQFWVYTRVFWAVDILWLLPNLSLYFSADPDNIDIANDLAETYKGYVNIAYVDETFAQGKAEFSKATRCPENNKAIPLISTKGSACIVCGLCVNGRNDVLFAVKKR